MKKNDSVILKIEGMTSEGVGIARHEGLAVFVPFSAPGDTVKCRILKVQKSYCYAGIEQVIDPAECRINPDCKAFGKCGGCELRHIEYAEELKWKAQFVKDAFMRLGGLDIPQQDIISTGILERYRNKAQFPVSENSGKSISGFYAPRSHRIVPHDDCILEPEIFNQIRNDILKYQESHHLPCYQESLNDGLLRHIYLRRGHYTHEIMVCLVVTEFTNDYDELAKMLMEKYPDIKTVLLNKNSRMSNVILGNQEFLLAGSGKIHDFICGIEVELSPHSFYQVNTPAAELLYSKAAEFCDLNGTQTLLDLYCGAGTIGVSMAKKCKKVIGVEIVADAVENARRNAERNGIHNAEFYQGDSGSIAQKLAESDTSPDIIIVDPPRKGCDTLTLQSIVKMSPKRVVMVSCDPATAARDVKFLCMNGYRADAVCPVDMFPRTRHVETVVLMSRVDGK